MKISTILLLLAGLAISQICHAQNNRPGQRGPTVVSPDIGSDRKVTFHVKAPEAETVILSGDIAEDTALEKGEDGLWSVTLGPIDPDIYFYRFVIDGVPTLDPSNPDAKIGFTTSTIVSILEVRADGPAFYDIKDVPHGVLRTHLYSSKSNNMIRELNVYTPPGYDANPDQRYPVLYLLHGMNNDHHSWHRYGRADEILDNLLADGAIQPFIVVMPLGYGGASADGQHRGFLGPRGREGLAPNLYERDIIEDVIPFIERNYRTISDQEHRAIVGFSMGGGHSSRIGLGNLDTFSYIGVMSAGMRGGEETEPLKTLAADPKAANEKIKLLWIACGRDDFAMPGARTMSENLNKIGIEHTFVETDGAHHWRVWRRYLRDLAPQLFVESKSGTEPDGKQYEESKHSHHVRLTAGGAHIPGRGAGTGG